MDSKTRPGNRALRGGCFLESTASQTSCHRYRVNVDPVHWFLNDKDDTRSSYFLEDAATEFQVQGLELDWACVTWDGDLRFTGSGWSFHDFRGDRWTNVLSSDTRRYLCNAYRVLLTRARQGMVIFVPPGDRGDPTRLSEFYDPTFKYLIDLGIPAVPRVVLIEPALAEIKVFWQTTRPFATVAHGIQDT